MLRFLILLCSLLVLAGPSLAKDVAAQGWELVFEDHFKGGRLDSRKWIRVPYVGYKGADWRRFQSQDERLMGFSSSSIKLWGRHGKYITQNNQQEAKETYACAGIKSRGKFSFQYGRVDVRARFSCVQGCWPAIWMMPDNSPGGWPKAGEIDIMEHLNHEEKIYQTLHMVNGGGGNMSRGVNPNPPISIKGARKARRKGPPPHCMSAWHVYSVRWTPEAITFLVDDRETGTIRPNVSPNWPFSRANNTFYLIIDQQIGGRWVEGSGAKGIDKKTLAGRGAVLEVDYVRVYADPKYKLVLEDKKEKKKKKPQKSKKKKKSKRKKAAE